jgi:hypothetical protein
MQNTVIFNLGDHVIVSDPEHCFAGAKGSIANPPAELMQSQGWKSYKHSIPADAGPVTLYWVIFETPQKAPFEKDLCESAAIAVDFLSPG